MKFRELLNTGFKSFSRMAEEKKLAQIDAVKYIMTIASTSGISVMDWDAQEVFTAGKSANEIVTDRCTINRLFFTHHEALQAIAPAAPISTELNEIANNTLKELSRRYVADLVARADNDANGKLNQARDYFRSAEDYLTKATVARQSISSLRNEIPDIAGQIKTLHEGKFWEYIGQKDGYQNVIRLKTRNDVVCNYRNATAGIDVRVNLGMFVAEFDISAIRVRVFKSERNVQTGEYYHPHISYDGSVCWGNASNSVSLAITNLRLVEIFSLLASVLTNYNNGNPYRSLEEFAKTASEPQPRSVVRAPYPRPTISANGEIGSVEICADCDNPVDDCRCNWCNDCDNHEDDCTCNMCLDCGNHVDDCRCNWCNDCDHHMDDCQCEPDGRDE